MASISLTAQIRWYALKKTVLFTMYTRNYFLTYLKQTLHYNIKYLFILKVAVETC